MIRIGYQEEHTGQSATHFAVLLAVGIEYGRRKVVYALDEIGKLAHFWQPALMADQMAINVLPRSCIREAEVLGRNTHDRAILFVHLLRMKRLRPAYYLPCPR